MKIQEIEKLVKPLYAKKDSMHDFNHIFRIKRKLSFLKKDYKKINTKRLNFLIYFHGLKDWVKNNKKKIFELCFDQKDIVFLERHTKNPKTTEEKLVHDANLLENIGEFGIKKCLAIEKETERERKDTIDFLKNEIKNIKFYTPGGKEVGRKKVKIIKDFIKKFDNR